MNPADFGFRPFWFLSALAVGPAALGILGAAVVRRYAKASVFLKGTDVLLLVEGEHR